MAIWTPNWITRSIWNLLRNCVGRSGIESVGDRGKLRFIIWPNSFYFEKLGLYEKNSCQVGAVFAHTEKQKWACDNFEGAFGVVQPESEWPFDLFQCREGNMDFSLFTWNQATAYTAQGFSQRIGAEVYWSGSVSQTRLWRLFFSMHAKQSTSVTIERKSSQQRILYQLIGRVKPRFEETVIVLSQE